MNKYIKIKKDEYYDSVTLMSLSAKLERGFDGCKIVTSMGTDMNLEILENLGFSKSDLESCTPNDLVVGIIAQEEGQVEAIVKEIDLNLYSSTSSDAKSEKVYNTSQQAINENEFNLGVISVPGEYAFLEAKKLLDNDIHVMMFSDNVSYEEELELKEYAINKNLLMMGPDCGTSIINGKGICFANDVNNGDIAIISASGTGLQEVSVLIDKLGGGISQAIGVGGRDLSEKIGGIMMKSVFDALENDPKTKTIVLISKPPIESVKNEIIKKVDQSKKRVIIYFIDSKDNVDTNNITFGHDLYDTAAKAVGFTKELEQPSVPNVLFKEEQKYIRGLYCGGTLCLESLSKAREANLVVYSNIAKYESEKLSDFQVSQAHSFIDLGDDFFTDGRPHPMIEPSIRLERLLSEANDPETKVILLDFELGYGAHVDPVGVTEENIKKAIQIRKDNNYGEIVFIGYILGTSTDYQGFEAQESKLHSLGVLTAKSNVQAIEMAIKIVGGNNEVR